MSDVLRVIGDDLRAAAARRAARRRRRRLLGFLGGVALVPVAAIAGAGAGGFDPLDGVWFGSHINPPATDVRRIDMRVPTRSGEWHTVIYVSRAEMLCRTAAFARRRAEQVGCNSGFTMVGEDARAPDPGIRSLSIFPGPRGYRLVSGTVADDVEALTLIDAAGERHPTQLSPETLTLPVNKPPDEMLTPIGRGVAARAPDSFLLRGFAAVVPSAARTPGDRPLRFEVRRADGTVTTSEGSPRTG